MKRRIMILGTSSSVGKSTIAAAFCRYFRNRGIDVAPYKALNISLNSYITKWGDEIGRSQVVQAECAKVEPKEYMNPILMKPGGGMTQVIVRGKVYKTIDAYKYKSLNEILKIEAFKAFKDIEKDYEMLVLEGSGGCAELNLKDTDIANMYMAVKTNTPVILVADIEKGGVFASVIGTLSILKPEEKRLVKGIIINKFRGNPEFFKEGIEIIESLTRVKVLGIMPYSKLNIEEEDGQTEGFNKGGGEGTVIKIIKLPHMSNFTDLNYLSTIDGISVEYIEKARDIEGAKVVVIPGSKNTIEDLRYLKTYGFKEELERFKEKGGKIIGICGGFQMLGKTVLDPYAVEGNIKEESGLDLLPLETTMERVKTTRQVKVKDKFGDLIEGYEIHNGKSIALDRDSIWIEEMGEIYGMKREKVYGTYIHGVFDNNKIIKRIIGDIKIKSTYGEVKEREYNKLEKILKENIDMEYVENIIKDWQY